VVDISLFGWLAGPDGRALLARLAAADLRESNTLALLTDLRRDLPPDVAGAALTLARLRQRAADKFSRADALFFTPDALEQASGEAVSGWRARRFAAGGCTRIADLACSVGGDTLALAGLPGVSVVGLDRDALRLHLARANLAAYGRGADLVQADLRDPLPLAGVPAAFFDPARREAGRRVFSVHDYTPPLAVIERWHFRALGVKLSPGVNLDELEPYTRAGAGVEFISHDGDLKEAVLWAGDLGFGGRWASVLAGDGSGATLLPQNIPAPPVDRPRAYLYEPDPAVIRAGLLGELAAELELAMARLDESIAYLTADEAIPSRWARVWPVLDWMPFQLKRLRAALRARGVGRVTVKKRGSAIAPEELIRRLKLDGDGAAAVVVLTRIAGQPGVLICGEPGT